MADIQHMPAGDAHPGSHGEAQLIQSANMAMRVWNEGPNQTKSVTAGQGGGDHASDYDTLGYVIDGQCELRQGDQSWLLTKGDSWFVPKGAMHRYEIQEGFRAVEVTSPPARGQALGGYDGS